MPKNQLHQYRDITPEFRAPTDCVPPLKKSHAAFSIAPFAFDVTPPLNHALLGGLVMPVIGHDDPLEAIGYVLLSGDAPIVVCALDWAGLLNDAHFAWRRALAKAAGTTPDRVAVQCVHQHNAPFACPGARATALNRGLPAMFETDFFDACLERAQSAVRAALHAPRPVSHVGHGRADVRRVASNRRIARDGAGRVLTMRGSMCADPGLRALPEGLIDPAMQTVAFFSGAEKIVSCHYYATHPMSYYRDGRVSSDFCGLARKRRQLEEPACAHLYFTGCAGDVAAGKYNDGSRAAREGLARRVHAGIVESESTLDPQPLTGVEWRTESILPRPQPPPGENEAPSYGTDAELTARLLRDFRFSWIRRLERQVPLELSCLRLNEISILNLPGEMFVEYQLRAQAMRPGRPVAVAAYGDDGPWYIPTKAEYPAGGYEVSVAFCGADLDDLITAAMRRLLTGNDDFPGAQSSAAAAASR